MWHEIIYEYSYRHLFQILLKFSVPWWNFSKAEGNLATAIVFGKLDNAKAGATGITDTKLSQVLMLILFLYMLYNKFEGLSIQDRI